MKTLRIAAGWPLPIVLVLWLVCGAGAGALELDETPPGPGDWGFRPEAGSTPAHNPPGFTWRPVAAAADYALEVASDPEFADVVYREEALPWSAHCPPMSFAPGTYHWRYAARDADGARTGWSRVRSFEVNEAATRQPQPALSDLLARLPEEHPRLFLRPEDVPRLRAMAGGSLAARWTALVEAADKLVARPPDVSEPPKYPEGTERKSGEWTRIWRNNRVRAVAVSEGAATLAFVYRIGGDERHGRAARDLLMALCEWDPRGATSFAYNDEAGMPVLYLASRAYSWAYPALSESDRRAVVDMMRVRGQEVFRHLTRKDHLWRPYDSHANRAWHFLGEAALAFQGEIEEADRWLDFAMTVMFTAYPVWGDADGGWHEGTAYWLSYNDRFMWWAAIVRAAFDIDVFERPFYRRTGYYPMYVLPPGTRTGGFGDQAESLRAERVANLVAVMALGARNPHWKWYADAAGADLDKGYLGFLYAARAGTLRPRPPADLPGSALFRGTGLAALNSNLLDGRDNVQVLFKSSPMGRRSHGYNANNAFLLNVGGERMFLSSGRRDVHGSPHHTEWMWESKSENAILVNGQGQKKHSAESTGRITVFDTSPELDTVEGVTADADSGLLSWRRRILFYKPGVILMHDVLETAEPSTFQWLLHAPGPFELGEGAAMWKGDAGRAVVRWLEPEGLVLSQTDRFDVPPADWTGWDLGQWHLTADAGERTTRREFITLIAVGDAEPRASVTRDDRGARVTLGLPTGDVEAYLPAEADAG